MAKKNNNVIPRKFVEIIGKIKVNTSMDKAGDELHIRKDDYNGYVAYNKRTGKSGIMSPCWIRNTDIFEMTSVEK